MKRDIIIGVCLFLILMVGVHSLLEKVFNPQIVGIKAIMRYWWLYITQLIAFIVLICTMVKLKC